MSNSLLKSKLEAEMENLFLSGTKSTPEVLFDAASGKLLMHGSSYPENAAEFYRPLREWIDRYAMELPSSINAEFSFKYMNSSSVKLISEFIDRLDKLHAAGIAVEINWYVSAGDEDIIDLGNEFREELKCKFTIIEH